MVAWTEDVILNGVRSDGVVYQYARARISSSQNQIIHQWNKLQAAFQSNKQRQYIQNPSKYSLSHISLQLVPRCRLYISKICS